MPEAHLERRVNRLVVARTSKPAGRLASLLPDAKPERIATRSALPGLGSLVNDLTGQGSRRPTSTTDAERATIVQAATGRDAGPSLPAHTRLFTALDPSGGAPGDSVSRLGVEHLRMWPPIGMGTRFDATEPEPAAHLELWPVDWGEPELLLVDVLVNLDADWNHPAFPDGPDLTSAGVDVKVTINEQPQAAQSLGLGFDHLYYPIQVGESPVDFKLSLPTVSKTPLLLLLEFAVTGINYR